MTPVTGRTGQGFLSSIGRSSASVSDDAEVEVLAGVLGGLF